MVKNKLLEYEINTIVNNTGSGVTDVKLSAVLHTEEYDFKLTRIETLEFLKNYNTNISDYIVFTFRMPLGDFIKDVYPNRDNIDITITREIFNVSYIKKFKCVILNNLSGVNGTHYELTSRDELNKQGELQVEVQCVDLLTEAMRIMQVDGTYRNITVGKLIHNLILDAINKVKSSGKKTNANMNLIEPDNTKIFNSIYVKSGTEVLNLPTYLQNTNYGVYNGDIGTYVDEYNGKHTVFVYPLYKTSTFDKVDKKLIIYSVPSGRYAMIENTYFIDGDIIKILSSSITSSSVDTSENEFINSGIGFIYSNSNNVMNRPVNVDEDVHYDANQLNIGEKFKSRRDSNDKFRNIGESSNPFKLRSAILKNTFSVMQVQWNFCNLDLLYPAMPLMYVYEDENGKLIKLKGTLQSVYAMYNNANKNVTALLNITVEKKDIKRGKD